ncbi:MAG: hypothetical protein PVF37_11045 [Desulfobacterales bacterium]|jgi:hypothetical protein
MKQNKSSSRQLKKQILPILKADDFSQGLVEIRRLPPRKVVGPLFSYLCSLDEIVKWRTVTAMGAVIGDLAATDLESARVVMRRFIWNLNDESGGIGWGCPESMAEAMVRDEKLAAEYEGMLLSYIRPDGNYLEHEGLQRGVLWGIGRLARSRVECMRAAASFLSAYMESDDPYLRGLAVWAVSPILIDEAIHRLQKLTRDPGKLTLYRHGRVARVTVGQLAQKALRQQQKKFKQQITNTKQISMT